MQRRTGLCEAIARLERDGQIQLKAGFTGMRGGKFAHGVQGWGAITLLEMQQRLEEAGLGVEGSGSD